MDVKSFITLAPERRGRPLAEDAAEVGSPASSELRPEHPLEQNEYNGTDIWRIGKKEFF